MKKVKEFILLLKVELVICVVAPILTAVLLNTSVTPNRDVFLFGAVGLFCLFVYGIVKMFFKVNKMSEVKFSEVGLNRLKSSKYRAFILVVAMILPVVGLTVNNALGGWSGNGVFGDFRSIWFYVIAILNGLIMLVDIRGDKLGLALFYLKMIGLTYIAYFAVVFMPLLPFGLIGLLFYGLGALIFVPLTVLATEIFQVLQDIKRLKTKFQLSIIIAGILGIATLPAIVAFDFTADKTNFHNALTYLSADSAEMPKVSLTRLERTLSHINKAFETRAETGGVFSNGANTPILSRSYQVVALDGKMLSPDTVGRLSMIFLGRDNDQPINGESGEFQNVNLVGVGINSEFDEEIGVYKTWVDLQLKNQGNSFLAEYRTRFLLPEGCFIKDYYLEVGAERKQGILADKRAALITYNNIIRTPKDPGIIYYTGDNIIELRVYPFEANQTRKTGFWVWHSQNEMIMIDGQKINLPAEHSITEPLKMPGISFIPAFYKKALPAYERMPQYCFIIDASSNSPYGEHLKKVNDFMGKFNISDARILAASYKVYETIESNVKCAGGFNLSLAMEMIFKEYENNSLSFPIIIAVSDNINKAPLFLKNAMAKQFPESEYYYNLGYDLSLTPYSFADNNRHDIVKSPLISKALAYDGLIVADNDKGEVIINGDFGSFTDNEYQNAFLLYGKTLLSSNDHAKQIELVRDSFRQRVLTKYTAFTVLETREQENALLELQAKLLNNEENSAPAVMMDEPDLLICLLMMVVLIIVGRKKKNNCIKL
ncbi:MAG: MSEP-CTERM sorting domain-containing protein [Clostridiales bacterium]|nr:MSEP-CTERM sorting domain-containing protein [Clostridiales bacterium]